MLYSTLCKSRTYNKEEHRIKRHILNELIRAKEVRVIDAAGTQIGILKTEEAIALAKKDNLDLLLVAQNSEPPVCKIVDFGHFLYEQKKKDKLAKKSSKGQTTKELKLSPNISEHDFQVRVKNAHKFLSKKYKIKVTLFFKGRQITHPELGEATLKKFISTVAEHGTPESDIIKSGKIFSVSINPK